MTDESNLTPDERDALTLWSQVGSPGPPPAQPYVPSGGDRSDQFTAIHDPAAVEVNWSLDDVGFEALRFGHYADAMEDKWDIYFDEPTRVAHFHRSWTGFEIFRFAVDRVGADNFVLRVEYETDRERYAPPEKESERYALEELETVLREVLGINRLPSGAR